MNGRSPINLNSYWLKGLKVLRCSVVSDSSWPHGLQPARFLCPWDSPGKNTRVGCHFSLQWIFLTQGSNPHLLPWQADSLPPGRVVPSRLTPILATVKPKQFWACSLVLLGSLPQPPLSFMCSFLSTSLHPILPKQSSLVSGIEMFISHLRLWEFHSNLGGTGSYSCGLRLLFWRQSTCCTSKLSFVKWKS